MLWRAEKKLTAARLSMMSTDSTVLLISFVRMVIFLSMFNLPCCRSFTFMNNAKSGRSFTTEAKSCPVTVGVKEVLQFFYT